MVLLAAGQGKRLGRGNKALLDLAGEPLLARVMRTCRNAPSVGEIIVVMNSSDIDSLAHNWGFHPAENGADQIVSGGKERWLSSRAGCEASTGAMPILLVHDVARALLTIADIEAVAQAAREKGCALAATPLADTLKKSSVDGCVQETIDRQRLWRAQTPQGGRRDWMLAAFASWQAPTLPTDEAMLLEAAGHAPTLVACSEHNFKITQSSDFDLAEALLQSTEPDAGQSTTAICGLKPCAHRTGLGWDRHRLVEGRPCILAGILIDCPVGPIGHSDADAALHALTDAILGAAGLDDLGTLFPDTDPRWEGADSATFLHAATQQASDAGWDVQGVDLVLVCDRPKIGPYRAVMRARLANWLKIDVSCVNIKGKTTENIGGVETVEATALVQLSPQA